ncbi:hypothetical protein BGZ59_001105 [Podila verticillata]|nr:hypothetical protein BGZ59_001105 [Podila verticillata]
MHFTMSLLVHANLSNTSSEYKLKDDQEPGNEGKHVFRRNDPAHVESTVVYILERERVCTTMAREELIHASEYLDLRVDQESGIVDETKGQS